MTDKLEPYFVDLAEARPVRTDSGQDLCKIISIAGTELPDAPGRIGIDAQDELLSPELAGSFQKGPVAADRDDEIIGWVINGPAPGAFMETHVVLAQDFFNFAQAGIMLKVVLAKAP